MNLPNMLYFITNCDNKVHLTKVGFKLYFLLHLVMKATRHKDTMLKIFSIASLYVKIIIFIILHKRYRLIQYMARYRPLLVKNIYICIYVSHTDLITINSPNTFRWTWRSFNLRSKTRYSYQFKPTWFRPSAHLAGCSEYQWKRRSTQFSPFHYQY